jgi:hypothetical protein
MRVIIEHDSQTDVATTGQGQTGTPVELTAGGGMSGGSPSAALLGNLGMSTGTSQSATTYDAGPPSPELVAAIAQAASSSPSSQSGNEQMNGGPAPTA